VPLVWPMEGMPRLTRAAVETETDCSEAEDCSTSRLPTLAETADEVGNRLPATRTQVSSLRYSRSIALTVADLDYTSCNVRQRWRHATTRPCRCSPAEQPGSRPSTEPRCSCSSAKQRRSRSGFGSRFCSYGWHWRQRLHVSTPFFVCSSSIPDAHLTPRVRLR
jgi:hypothetical protein